MKAQDDQLSPCVRWWQLKVTNSNSLINAWGKSRELMQTSSSYCLTVLENYFLNNTAHIKENRIYRGFSMIGNSNNTASNSNQTAAEWRCSELMGNALAWLVNGASQISNQQLYSMPLAITTTIESICFEIEIKKWKKLKNESWTKPQKLLKLLKQTSTP